MTLTPLIYTIKMKNMKSNNRKPMSIEDLAEMINKGFMGTQDHVNSRIDHVDSRIDEMQKNILEELNAMHEDVRYLKNTVTVLVQSDAAQDTSIEHLHTRVHRVEKKIGLIK